jgi:hypothetical protein
MFPNPYCRAPSTSRLTASIEELVCDIKACTRASAAAASVLLLMVLVRFVIFLSDCDGLVHLVGPSPFVPLLFKYRTQKMGVESIQSNQTVAVGSSFFRKAFDY